MFCRNRRLHIEAGHNCVPCRVFTKQPSSDEFKEALWQKLPAVFPGSVKHWPACSGPDDRIWENLEGLKRRIGANVVPVEVYSRGKGYLDPEVHHQPVKLADFLDYCVAPDARWNAGGGMLRTLSCLAFRAHDRILAACAWACDGIRTISNRKCFSFPGYFKFLHAMHVCALSLKERICYCSLVWKSDCSRRQKSRELPALS
jgi:hypothetical protein